MELRWYYIILSCKNRVNRINYYIIVYIFLNIIKFKNSRTEERGQKGFYLVVDVVVGVTSCSGKTKEGIYFGSRTFN